MRDLENVVVIRYFFLKTEAGEVPVFVVRNYSINDSELHLDRNVAKLLEVLVQTGEQSLSALCALHFHHEKRMIVAVLAATHYLVVGPHFLIKYGKHYLHVQVHNGFFATAVQLVAHINQHFIYKNPCFLLFFVAVWLASQRPLLAI